MNLLSRNDVFSASPVSISFERPILTTRRTDSIIPSYLACRTIPHLRIPPRGDPPGTGFDIHSMSFNVSGRNYTVMALDMRVYILIILNEELASYTTGLMAGFFQ